MTITTLDIRQQQFGVKFRGYDMAEVNAFLEMVSTELEAAFQERDNLRDQLERRQQDLVEFKERERDLQKSLSAVQQVRVSSPPPALIFSGRSGPFEPAPRPSRTFL